MERTKSRRAPRYLAKAAATTDQLSDGRVDVGLGAGWFGQEFDAFGYRFGTVGERFDALEDALAITSGLFGGAVVTETVFSLPGVGLLLTDSILGKDLPTVQAIVLFLTVAVVLTSFVVDLVYGVLDPRVRVAHG